MSGKRCASWRLAGIVLGFLLLALVAHAQTANDPDKDGLPDSSEAKLGTDPNNPDTDGDHFPDGGELFQAYNPLSAASNPGTGAAVKSSPPPGFNAPAFTQCLTSLGLSPNFANQLTQNVSNGLVDGMAGVISYCSQATPPPAPQPTPPPAPTPQPPAPQPAQPQPPAPAPVPTPLPPNSQQPPQPVKPQPQQTQQPQLAKPQSQPAFNFPNPFQLPQQPAQAPMTSAATEMAAGKKSGIPRVRFTGFDFDGLAKNLITRGYTPEEARQFVESVRPAIEEAQQEEANLATGQAFKFLGIGLTWQALLFWLAVLAYILYALYKKHKGGWQ